MTIQARQRPGVGAILLWLLVLAGPVLGQRFTGLHGYNTVELQTVSENIGGEAIHFTFLNLYLVGNYFLSPRAQLFGEFEIEHATVGQAHDDMPDSRWHVAFDQAWLDYELAPALVVRLGKFRPPFGIYNEISDADPAYDPGMPPVSVYGSHLNPAREYQRSMPKFSTGAQLFGRLRAGAAELEYRVSVVGARGSDLLESRGLGLRLITYVPEHNLQIGGSVYTDRNQAALNARQAAYGVDLQWQRGQWWFAGEAVLTTFEGADRDGGETQRIWAGYMSAAYQITNRQVVHARYERRISTRVNRESNHVLAVGTGVALTSLFLPKLELQYRTTNLTGGKNKVLAVVSLNIVF